MKLKFKMQKALVQQRQQIEQLSQVLREENDDNNLESSALHGLAAVAVAVEADEKGHVFDSRQDLMKQALDYESATLDICKIKLEREEDKSTTRQDSSAIPTDASSPNSLRSFSSSDSLLVNNNRKAYAPSDCESKTDHLSSQIAVNNCTRSEEPEPEQLVGGASSRTRSPLSAGIDAATITAVGANHQQQVRVIKDGRYYEDGHASHSPVAAAAALLALNGKQDLRITQISNSQSCRSGGGFSGANGKQEPSSNLVNVITLGNGTLALDSVKLKLGENDTQIFRAPMVTSTTSQLTGGGTSGGVSESASGGVVVTVESSMSSMRPPAVPPRVHQQQLHGHSNGGLVSMKKQSPSSTTQHNHHQNHMGNGSASSSSLSPAAEEPSSSIPDLGESKI